MNPVEEVKALWLLLEKRPKAEMLAKEFEYPKLHHQVSVATSRPDPILMNILVARFEQLADSLYSLAFNDEAHRAEEIANQLILREYRALKLHPNYPDYDTHELN